MFGTKKFTDLDKMQELEAMLEQDTLEPTKIKGLAARNKPEPETGSGFIKTILGYMKEGYENNKTVVREPGTIPAVDLANRLRKARSEAPTEALQSQTVDNSMGDAFTPVDIEEIVPDVEAPKQQRQGLMSRPPEPRPDDLNTDPSAPSGDPEGELFDYVVSGESKDYNTVYSKAKIKPPKPVTEMSVEEVRAFQDQMVASGSDSSAIGRFQIIRGTMDDLIKNGVISPDDTFNEETQQKAYASLIERRGYSTFKAQMAEAETEAERTKIAQKFQLNMAKEFASIPVPYDMTRIDDKGRKIKLRKGDSYYKGVGNNKALHTSDSFMQMLLREF